MMKSRTTTALYLLLAGLQFVTPADEEEEAFASNLRWNFNRDEAEENTYIEPESEVMPGSLLGLEWNLDTKQNNDDNNNNNKTPADEEEEAFASNLRGDFNRDEAEEKTHNVPESEVMPGSLLGLNWNLDTKQNNDNNNNNNNSISLCSTETELKWHPSYAVVWAIGYCQLTRDCDSPGFNTQLQCCLSSYSGQASGACLNKLDAPPTATPTNEETISPTSSPIEFYPDYTMRWSDAHCINAQPVPFGRPVFTTLLECCQAMYSSQHTGKCLSMLESPLQLESLHNVFSPAAPQGTEVGYLDKAEEKINNVPESELMPGLLLGYRWNLATNQNNDDNNSNNNSISLCSTETELKWHPSYSMAWAIGYCQLTRDCDSPGSNTQLQCCLSSYSGQVSGACFNKLDAPPTATPTNEETISPTSSPIEALFYPDFTMRWSDAHCINAQPVPFGRPVYTTLLECCQAMYSSQYSGKCFSMLESPPTAAPQGTEADFFYPRYEEPWSISGCGNAMPLPFRVGDRPTYATQLECCLGAYRGQKSDNCLGELPEPPTLSPTRITDSPSEAPSVGKPWYPDFETEWTEAGCLDTLPFPFPHESRRTYTREIDCCKKEYNGQRSNACMCQSDTLSDKQKLKKCPDFDPNERP